MRAIEVERPGGDFVAVERAVPSPDEHDVLVRVEACGVCHGDAIVKEGQFPNLRYPRVPGHEVVGTIAQLGSRVRGWSIGQRIGVGWHGGHCFQCAACRAGRFGGCEHALTTGISSDGGYAEYMLARSEALVSIPDELSSIEAAPLLCAGSTTLAAIKSSRAAGGDLIAIHGLGGLGHLATQWASKLGLRVCVLSRGKDKEDLARTTRCASLHRHRRDERRQGTGRPWWCEGDRLHGAEQSGHRGTRAGPRPRRGDGRSSPM